MTTTAQKKTRADGVQQTYHVGTGRERTAGADAQLAAALNPPTDAGETLTPEQQEMYDVLGLSEADFEPEFIIGSQDSAGIGSDHAWMTVRGGGLGGDAYLARITGTDPKWGIKRDFVFARKNLSGSGASGGISWELEDDGIYEYRRWCSSSRHTTGGFIAVKNGQVASLGDRRASVRKAAAHLDRGVTL